MSKIITAEDFLEKEHPSTLQSIIDGDCHYEEAKSYIQDWLIDFAKMHVELALKEASEKFEHPVNRNVILNAYPLDNIK